MKGLGARAIASLAGGAASSLLSAGCMSQGSSTTSSTVTTSTTSTTPSTTVSLPQPCTELSPIRLELTGVLAPDVAACTSRDGNWLVAKNVSKLVLSVRALGDLPAKLGAARAMPSSFGDQAAATAVGPGFAADGSFTLPSGAILYASSNAALGLRFTLDAGDTVKANTARAAGAWLDSKFTSPAASFGQKVQTCATSAGNLASGQEPQSAAIRTGLGLHSCAQLIDAVLASEGKTAAEAPSAIDELLAVAKRLAGGSFDDVLAGAIEVGIRR